MTQKPPDAVTLSENLSGRFHFLVTEVIGGRLEYFRWTADRNDEPSPGRLLSLGLQSGVNWLAARVNEPPVEALYFDIRFKHVEKLRKWRNEAMRLGKLTKDQKQFVPASVRHGNRVVRVRLRLKGDRTDHLRRNKWSYRIEVRGGDHLLGMRRFSIQHPGTRVYETEALYLEHMRREGVLAPRYTFVEAVINGDSIGRMALEEHFSKELLSTQRRPESVIIRFDEEQFWRDEFAGIGRNPYDNYSTALVRPFRQARINRSPTLKSRAKTAVGLLKGFQRGSLPASSVFDTDLVANFLAVSELWSASHALHWINLRFYFNPITGLLEPIPFDNGQMPPSEEIGLVAWAHPFWEAVLGDPVMHRKYRKAVRDLAARFAADGAESWLEESGRRHLRVLHAEFPYLMPLRTKRLKDRARSLVALPMGNGNQPQHRIIHWKVAELPSDGGNGYVSAFLYDSTAIKRIEVINKIPLPVYITNVRWSGNDGAGPKQIAFDDLPLLLPATRLFAKPLPIVLELPLQADGNHGNIELEVRVENATQGYFFSVLNEPPPRARATLAGEPSPSVGELLSEFPFLEFKQGTISVKPGVWIVERSIRPPGDVLFRVPAGTTLRFRRGAGIIAKGPVNAQGSEAEPVTFEGADGLWPGIAVLNAKEKSSWRHVFVKDVAGWTQSGWNPTGAVTFYRSPATFEKCVFMNSMSEDMLNLVQARFDIQDISIRNSTSDALDADFAELVVRGGDIFRNWGRCY